MRAIFLRVDHFVEIPGGLLFLFGGKIRIAFLEVEFIAFAGCQVALVDAVKPLQRLRVSTLLEIVVCHLDKSLVLLGRRGILLDETLHSRIGVGLFQTDGAIGGVIGAIGLDFVTGGFLCNPLKKELGRLVLIVLVEGNSAVVISRLVGIDFRLLCGDRNSRHQAYPGNPFCEFVHGRTIRLQI